MDDKAAWIQRVLGVTMVAPPAVADKQDAGTDEAIREELRDRIREMVGDIKVLADRSLVPKLAALANDANAAVKGDDLVAAEIAVDELEMGVVQARSATPAPMAESRSGLVKYRKAQIAWNQARGVARAGLERLGQAVMADPELQDDEDYDEIAALAGQFTTLLPQFDDELAEMVDSLEDAVSPEAREPLIAALKHKVTEYRDTLKDAEGLAELQALADDSYGGVPFFHSLDQALQSLQAAIV